MLFLLRDSGSTPRLCHLQVGWLFWGCWRRLLCGSLSPCNLNHIEGVGRTLPPGLSALLWSACRPQRGHPHVTNGPRPCLRVLTRTSPPGWRPAPSVLEPKAAPGSLPGSGLSRGRPLHIQAEPHDEGGRQDAPPGPSGPGSESHPLEDTPRPPPPWILQSHLLQLLEESLGAKSAPLQQGAASCSPTRGPSLC